ncbi:hypothetical protein PQG89_18975, partial [Parabacteroides johnsonii]|nr:hypothetical protein [Parabacteroides johnsonii]
SFFEAWTRVRNYSCIVLQSRKTDSPLNNGQIATLVKGKALKYAGKLYPEEHKRKFTTGKAILRK